MHICFINRSYYPDPEAAGQLLTELAEDLAAKGEEVSVVCGRSYHVRQQRRTLLPDVEVRNGVRIARAFNTRLPKSSLLCRLINLGTFLAGCLPALCLVKRPDVVVCQTDPPLLPLLAGVYARLARARFVFAINDLYPEVARQLGRISSPVLLKLLELATSFGIRHSELVIVPGEDMRAAVMKKGYPCRRIVVRPHWADTERIRPRKERNEFRRRHGLKPWDFIVMYSGNVGLLQGLEDAVRVAAEFRDFQNVHFVIVGEGANKARLQAMARGLQLNGKVRFLPYQPKERLDQSLSAADLHLIPLSEGVSGSIVPSKVYGIMASGTPYLAVMAESGDVVRIARRYGCGFWCPPKLPGELKERIEFALKNPCLLRLMGRNGRRAAEQNFSRASATYRYQRLLNSLG